MADRLTVEPDGLDRFLARLARGRFSYGQRDCALAPLGDWVLELGGVDPSAPLRGRYRSAVGCARVLAREGGLAPLARRLASAAGLTETKAPRRGDVAVVEIVRPVRGRPMRIAVGAIATGKGWAMFLEGLGVTISSGATMIVAWRIEPSAAGDD